MNKLIIIVAGGALSAAACAQTVPGAPDVEAVRVPASAARIEFPAQLNNMWYDAFDKVKGTYYLSNGRTMQLSLWGNRIYARIDGVGRLPMVAVSPYVFVARNLQLKVSIDDPDTSADHLHATVALAAPLAPRLSTSAPASQVVTLLARR